MLAKHTPNMSWTLNEMFCDEMGHIVVTKIVESALRPVQWGKLRTPKGAIFYMMFWHMIGAVPTTSGSNFTACRIL